MSRLEAYCKALGWQSSTLEDVADITKCSVADLSEGKPSSTHLASDYTKGWFAVRTCSIEHNKLVNFPNYIGNVDFWLGVAAGLTIDS